MTRHQKFGERLRKAREERGLTQAALIEEVNDGLNQALLYKYEAGLFAPRAARLGRLARILGVNQAWLSGLDDDEPATIKEVPLAPDQVMGWLEDYLNEATRARQNAERERLGVEKCFERFLTDKGIKVEEWHKWRESEKVKAWREDVARADLEGVEATGVDILRAANQASQPGEDAGGGPSRNRAKMREVQQAKAKAAKARAAKKARFDRLSPNDLDGDNVANANGNP